MKVNEVLVLRGEVKWRENRTESLLSFKFTSYNLLNVILESTCDMQSHIMKTLLSQNALKMYLQIAIRSPKSRNT